MRPEDARCSAVRTRHCDQTGSGVLLAPKTQRRTKHLEISGPFCETTQLSDCQGPSAAHWAKQREADATHKNKAGAVFTDGSSLHGFKIAKSCNACKVRCAGIKSGNTCVLPLRPRGTQSPPTGREGGQSRSGPPFPPADASHLPGARSSRAEVHTHPWRSWNRTTQNC